MKKIALKSNNYYSKIYYRNIRKARKERIRKLIKYIKNKSMCMDCATTNNLTFDHVEGSNKCFNIGDAQNFAFNKVNKELLKCEIVCRTCHDIREYTRGNGYKFLGSIIK